ncbi:transposase [Stenotrophomonas sp. SORGH_AS_0321]|uniref:REP-associated tyrosine transposase n=1 Tax=Stenotrophomonas sp. SORGH_AS_0321 TaxID=3041787 RepID=UPI002854B926|nr:transposase [Stenotrophomonas sp. SORGH_AS_0321]MDR6094187.1 putative transposase [Stenotrophomonas sp. SORGH_AS_0321]
MSSRHHQRGRFSRPGGIYVLTTVTRGRLPVFETADRARIVIDCLRDIERARISHSFAWVVMPDHVHWLLQLRQGTLGACMQRFKSRSSRLIGQAAGSALRLWQPSYFEHALRSDESLLKQARYIAANPVRAGLVDQLGVYPFAWCRWPSDP